MTFFPNSLYFISFCSTSINCRFLNLKLVVVIQLVRVLPCLLYILFPPFFKDFHSYPEAYSFSSVLFILACCIDWIFLHFIFMSHCLSDFFPLGIHKHLVFPLSSITFTANSQACNHFCKCIYLFQILYSIANSLAACQLFWKKLVFPNFFPNFSDNCILRTSIF